MVGHNRFFYDYFDGQIVKSESEKFRLFKVMLFSVVSLLGLFSVLCGFCDFIFFALLELGMVWNFYVKLDSKLSIVFCVAVSVLYFAIACYFKIYATAFIYVGFYIPFQMFATTKSYYNGSFVQIRKEMSDGCQVLFTIFAIAVFVVFYMLDVGFGSNYAMVDAGSASCLVASAVLRNERYGDYYTFRIAALILSVALWIAMAIEYEFTSLYLVALMYFAYLLFDVASLIEQKVTYENQYMQLSKHYWEIENKKIVEKKLKEYKTANEKK